MDTISGVLLELAGYPSLLVTLTLVEEGQRVSLTGSPVELMAQLEEFGREAEITSFSWG